MGYYGLAFQFASLPIDKLVSVVNQVAFPSLSLVQNDAQATRHYYLKLVSGVAVITFPMFLGLFLVADSGVRWLLPARWLPVILPLKVLCLVSCLRALNSINTPLILAKGEARLLFMNNLLRAVLMPAAFWLGAPWGLEGVALAWMLAFPIIYVIITLQTLRLGGVTFGEYLNALKPCLASSAAMIAVVALVQIYALDGIPDGRMMLTTCVLGGVIYFGYHALFSRDAIYDAVALVRRAANRPAPLATP